MMRLALDGTPLLGPRSGVGEVVSGIVPELARRPEVDVVAYALTLRGRKDLAAAVPPGVRAASRWFPARGVRQAWLRAEYPRVEQWTGRIDVVHAFLAASYWARGIPRATVKRSIEGSLCFGLYDASGRQLGFARVVTDFATFAWVGDVFVLEEARGRGLAVWLMEVVAAHPDLQGLRRWGLVTRDAHGLYEKFGFAAPANPAGLMEIARPGMYLEGSGLKA